MGNYYVSSIMPVVVDLTLLKYNMYSRKEFSNPWTDPSYNTMFLYLRYHCATLKGWQVKW